MDIYKLWTKLFTRNKESREIALHVSGATVRHRNPFETIEVPVNDIRLDQPFLNRWVIPYYMNSPAGGDEKTVSLFAEGSKDIDAEVVGRLLGDFNWRPRISGAYFTAIKKYQQFEDLIGKLLLKSEVAYAGAGYCLALAVFGTEKSKNYLKEYLDYYLDRKDLYFDQAHAYCALEYIDKEAALLFSKKYEIFVADKPYWDLDASRKQFATSMRTIRRIQDSLK